METKTAQAISELHSAINPDVKHFDTQLAQAYAIIIKMQKHINKAINLLHKGGNTGTEFLNQ